MYGINSAVLSTARGGYKTKKSDRHDSPRFFSKPVSLNEKPEVPPAFKSNLNSVEDIQIEDIERILPAKRGFNRAMHDQLASTLSGAMLSPFRGKLSEVEQMKKTCSPVDPGVYYNFGNASNIGDRNGETGVVGAGVTMINSVVEDAKTVSIMYKHQNQAFNDQHMNIIT